MVEVGRRLVGVSILVIALIGCTSARPSPSPLATTAPSAAASGAPSQSAGAPSPTAASTPAPTAGASDGPTPAASPSAALTPEPPVTAPPTGSFDPDAISLTTEAFASGFTRLTFVTHAGDGSGVLYAVEQGGRVVPVTPGEAQGAPLLDISDRVRAGGEQGLLGLAFHPDFESNGRFFVDYTNRAGNTVVSEFIRGADGSVDAAAERVLLTVKQPFSNHNGGMIAFGPDGYLYIALGDGGSGGDPFGNGQDLGTRLGKLLRIDVNSGDPYGIPADNPFADGAGGAAPEIWDLGLRNPWRFSFDRQTGGLFIADVGQSELEEINAEPAGQGGRNYGWNIMEGDRCYASGSCNRRGLTLPVAVYSHAEGCSVTGGYVYRGGAFPQLFGGYVFADYCSGTIWAINADRALAGASLNPIELGNLGFNASSFAEDESGELYVVEHGGTIHRLVAVPR